MKKIASPPRTIGVALSGGVDSTVAAALLQEQGHAVEGFFMQLPLKNLAVQQKQVQAVAEKLALPLHLIDLREAFTHQIIRPFCAHYQSGVTPNPCISCNQHIKFGLLAQAVLDHGMDAFATGHYARIEKKGAHLFVARGTYQPKDQSYFLAALPAERLQHILFPLCDLSKKAVYAKAQALGFIFDTKESQDVCFLEHSLPAFFAAQGISRQPGPIVTTEGKQIGQHNGLWHYTIGQRRGLALPDVSPWYVLALDCEQNHVVVGKAQELFTKHCLLHPPHWLYKTPALPWKGWVQLRSRHLPALAQVSLDEEGQWHLDCMEAQRAITPGQCAVFYEEERIIGSAIISKSQRTNA